MRQSILDQITSVEALHEKLLQRLCPVHQHMAHDLCNELISQIVDEMTEEECIEYATSKGWDISDEAIARMQQEIAAMALATCKQEGTA